MSRNLIAANACWVLLLAGAGLSQADEGKSVRKPLGVYAKVDIEDATAALDKLSVMPALNCHEAIAGIYESLKRLHEWELSRLKEENDMRRKIRGIYNTDGLVFKEWTSTHEC